jgi:hypothetical protein
VGVGVEGGSDSMRAGESAFPWEEDDDRREKRTGGEGWIKQLLMWVPHY